MDQIFTAIKFASATSDMDNTNAALDQILDQLQQQTIGDIDLMVMFVTPHHAHEMDHIAARLRSVFSPGVMIAVTAEGVIGVRQEMQNSPGLSVLAASAPSAKFKPFYIDQPHWRAMIDDPQVIPDFVAIEGQSPLALMIMGDPFSTPIMHMLPAFNSALPQIPIVGGMASGARRPGDNRLLLDDHIYMHGTIGVAIGGDIQVDTTVSQGCRPIGQPYVITKCKRHVLLELGGRNPLQIITEMINELNEYDHELVGKGGLLVGRVIDEYKGRFGRGDFLIRNLLRSESGGDHIAINDANVCVGQTIQFHIRDQQTAREDFSLLLEAQKVHGPGAGALLFSCSGRGTNLFDQPDADAQMLYDALGDIPVAGFFAAGEIGPVGGVNFVHGHTASLLVFRAAEV
jgi:small ligand-binding sensory domain FIST